MRRQLAVLVAATTSLVLIAFLIPLGYLVQQVAADRAVNAATREAEGLAPVVATVDRDVLELTLQQVANDDAEDYPLSVFLPDGTVLGEPAERSPAVDLAAAGTSLVVDTGSGREVLVAVQGLRAGTAVVRGFVPNQAMREGVDRAWAILVALGLALLALSIVVADRLARTLVRPMRELADVSHRLGEGDLQARVRPAGPPELQAVGHGVNHLAGRIGELLICEREAVADLSHRLRTPLTALRLDAESLSDPADSARVTSDVDALTRTVDDVINEARRPVREGVSARCDAAKVVTERLHFWSALADEEGREVTSRLAPGPLPVRTSEQDLSTMLDALLGNVFAHTPAGTAFCVELASSDSRYRHVHGHGESHGPEHVTLIVSDQGSGFDGSDPFARGNSGTSSTGLGLDIVRRTADASGGSVSVGPGPGGRIMVLMGSVGRAGRQSDHRPIRRG